MSDVRSRFGLDVREGSDRASNSQFFLLRSLQVIQHQHAQFCHAPEGSIIS
jgi:hypothetical protein